jgi:GPH family glycoside/pentoside/hexuronide:cation symporter
MLHCGGRSRVLVATGAMALIADACDDPGETDTCPTLYPSRERGMQDDSQEIAVPETADYGAGKPAGAAPATPQKLSLVEKAGFSLGDAACNLFFQTWILFSTIFYTDVFLLSADLVALMFLVTKVWDAAVDPIVGMIADRTETRWGKFRPYLLWFAIPFGVLGVLAFTTPGFGTTGRLIYAYITYALMMTVYSVVNVPYAALMGVMTPDSNERTVLSSYRFFAAFFATLLVQYSVLRMVERFGHGNTAVGWQGAMMVLSALAVVLLFISFGTTKERVRPPKGQKTRLKQDLGDLFTNVPWLLIGAATVFQLIFYCMRVGAIPYYFTYFVKDQTIPFFGMISYQKLLSTFLVTGTAATLLGVLLSTRISRLLGKSLAYALFLGIGGVASAVFYFLGPRDVVLMFVLQIIVCFSIGPFSVLQWSIYTDAADYGEWKKGRRSTALVMAASLFALKVGVAVGGSLLAWILWAYGYVENQQQTATGLAGIRMVTTVYPAIFALLGMAFMFFYPLNKVRMAQVQSDLIARRERE